MQSPRFQSFPTLRCRSLEAQDDVRFRQRRRQSWCGYHLGSGRFIGAIGVLARDASTTFKRDLRPEGHQSFGGFGSQRNSGFRFNLAGG